MLSSFWVTQPVDDRADAIPFGAATGPLPLPFRFSAFDPLSATDIERLRCLLAGHYVEDAGASFRLEYSSDLLRWALTPPGYERDWCVAIADGGGAIGGFVFAAPMAVTIDGQTRDAVVVNFLCVRRDLRGLGLGPILIGEITRRVVDRGRFCALFSTAVRLPMEPLATCRYFCRFLRPRELAERGYAAVPDYLTLPQFERIHALPDPAISLRRMTEQDLPAVAALFERRTSPIRLQLTASDLGNALLGSGVVEAWVAEDGSGNVIAAASYVRTAFRHTTLGLAVEAAYWYHSASAAELAGPLFDAVCQRAAEGGAQLLFVLEAGPLADIARSSGLVPTNGGLRYYAYNWRVSGHMARDIEVPAV